MERITKAEANARRRLTRYSYEMRMEEDLVSEIDDLVPDDWHLVDADFPCDPPKAELTIEVDRDVADAFRKMGGDVDGRVNRILGTWLQMKIAGLMRTREAMRHELERLRSEGLLPHAVDQITDERPDCDEDPEDFDQDRAGIGAIVERPEDQPCAEQIDEVKGRPRGIDPAPRDTQVGARDAERSDNAEPIDEGHVSEHDRRLTDGAEGSRPVRAAGQTNTPKPRSKKAKRGSRTKGARKGDVP